MDDHAGGAGHVPMPERDEELALRSQRGDSGAYAELVRRHRRAVHAVARGILGSAEEAEDATQESFLRAYRGLRTYNGHHAFARWMRRITVNCAISRLREQRRERGHLQTLSTADNPKHGPDPADRVATAEAVQSIRAAVRHLPLRQGLAFVLFHIEGMSLAETAQAMGCSVNAIKVQLHRARRALARRLADRVEQE